MIDFIDELYGFSKNGFNIGYFTIVGEHMQLFLIKSKRMKISATVCFHDKTKKYAFKLLIDKNPVYHGIADDEESMEKVVDEIMGIVDEEEQ